MLAGNYFSKQNVLKPSNRVELIASLISASRISKWYFKHLNKELRASNKKKLQQVFAILSKNWKHKSRVVSWPQIYKILPKPKSSRTVSEIQAFQI